jgi:hypothetical protein
MKFNKYLYKKYLTVKNNFFQNLWIKNVIYSCKNITLISIKIEIEIKI